MTTIAQRLALKRRAVHAACRELGMDDDTRRDMMQRVAGVRSTTDLDLRKADLVLDHLNKSGAKLGKKDVGRRKDKPKDAAITDQVAKIEAQLADMKLPWQYAHSMARHMFKVERLEWCNGAQLGKIIAALAYEQEKRALLEQVDGLLRAAGKTQDDLTFRLTGVKNGDTGWKRNKKQLERLIQMVPQWWPAA
ncbi:MAG TPA: regulatory protein GemA [Rhodocyclaceae bacterium]|nr:regulatory protein GemA [Rhodocyclaceae bacterium]